VIDSHRYEVAVIGGGIVGLAAARALLQRGVGSLLVLETETELARHQTGHNSGVIHSGLYYRPGSLKAQNCVAGREQLYAYCDARGVKYKRCGKLVVATDTREKEALDRLEARGRANGLRGLRRVSGEELREYEPHCSGIAALHVPETGIVDFAEVARTLAEDVQALGGEIKTGHRVTHIRLKPSLVELQTPQGAVRARCLVNCAGLYADRIARQAGLQPPVCIVPFRGEYYSLRDGREHLVKNLIYPVPDPRFPFLGVHCTRMIHGEVEIGPNAVLAFKRTAYAKASFSLRDTLELFAYRGFWRMGRRYWKLGLREMYRSWSRRAFVEEARRLVPDIRPDDVYPARAGVRAQAVTPEGALLDDFCIVEGERMVHVLNAPSPAATASMSIGDTIAQRTKSKLDGS